VYACYHDFQFRPQFVTKLGQSTLWMPHGFLLSVSVPPNTLQIFLLEVFI
jgi:hypothetical protein